MNLFTVLAGKSKDTFQIGGVTFLAAPFTISEYEEYRAATDDLPPGEAFRRKAEILAEKLGIRIHGVKPVPADITPDWVRENVPLPTLPVLEHIMLYGKMPEAGEAGKT